MGNKTPSQWDFGELFEPAATRRVLTVSELTGNVRRLLERDFRQIWIVGEITNLRAQASGHIYFTLKDSNAQLSCVLFRNELVPHRELLQDGQKVILRGDVTVYEARGQYQLRVVGIELQGVGALQAAFELLKKKLQADGLFDPGRKRPLPRYPQRIGLVTSSSGAAIRDVLHVFQRRHPGLEILLASCRVQGVGAAEEIACAVRLLNEWSGPMAVANRRIDLILLTRGGGSLEDLWAFNEEVVARAIFESQIPVVSAIGHEIDFTISDFVADFRAATPSAAAEIISDGVYASRQMVADAAVWLRQLVQRRLTESREEIVYLQQRLARVHPRRLLDERSQHLDELAASLGRCGRRAVRQELIRLFNLQQRLSRLKPSLLIVQRQQDVAQHQQRLQLSFQRQLEKRRAVVDHLATRLRLLGPENILARGYSITTKAATGEVVRAAKDVAAGEALRTRLAQGAVISTATSAGKIAVQDGSGRHLA